MNWLKQSRICDGVVELRDWTLAGLRWTRAALRRLLHHPIRVPLPEMSATLAA